MAGVELVSVSADDGEVRLDRWFKRHYPQLTQGQLQKLLRSKQIKVDGKKAEASQHLTAGQVVRVPPLPEKGSPMAQAKARFCHSLVFLSFRRNALRASLRCSRLFCGDVFAESRPAVRFPGEAAHA